MVYRSSNCFVYAIADLFRDEPVCWMTVPQPIFKSCDYVDVNNIGDLSRLPVKSNQRINNQLLQFSEFQ